MIMEQELDYKITSSIQYADDYAVLLEQYGFQCRKTDFYWEVGEPQWIQGWILNISVIYTQIESLLAIILPLLTREQTAFRIAQDVKTARAVLNGEYGYQSMGKLITIYPADETHALKMAEEINSLTKGFRGPDILTDRKLGDIVYTRYGAGKGILVGNQSGVEEKFIYDRKGDLVRDPYNIPFLLPEGVKWPFGSIAPSNGPKKETVLQDKYKPIVLLKEDVKGAVRKGLYLEKWYRIKWCVIKEGKRNILSDSRGRDVTDRLRWQYELQKDLEGIVPMPRVYDLFEENGDTYMVMEFIKGTSLEKIVTNKMSGNTWQQLTQKDKLELLSYIIQAIDIIGRMHQKGYLHRDITPGNFLVDNHQKLWMIDLELAFCDRRNKPSPPFRLGTPGYMSPEQLETLLPTVAQDVYAFGALCIQIFTGLIPEKFAQGDPIALKDQLSFFIQYPDLVETIAACQDEDPSLRPGIPTLKKHINRVLQEESSVNASYDQSTFSRPDKEKLNNFIANALDGLASPELLNMDHLWVAKTIQTPGLSYKHDMSMSVYPDFYQGVSGVIWLLARAQTTGFPLHACKKGFEKSWDFIKDKISKPVGADPGGLYFGNAGVAMAIAETIEAGLVWDRAGAIRSIQYCLQNDTIEGLGMTKGLAGKGMVLLRMIGLLDKDFVEPLLHQIIGQLLADQREDGSWLTTTDENKRLVKATGFGHGVAGITCFLLTYIKQFDDETVKSAAIRALHWLTGLANKKRGYTRWPLNDQTKQSSFDFQDGSLGIMLCLVKSYEIFHMEDYRRLAEECVFNYPALPISWDLTQIGGLSGWGEVFLEGARVFHNKNWQARADWIAVFLLHHYHKEKEGPQYWMPDGSPFTTAGLMEGNSGIIHFLLRYHAPEELCHPLLAF
jgi:serine/threonine protein kinase